MKPHRQHALSKTNARLCAPAAAALSLLAGCGSPRVQAVDAGSSAVPYIVANYVIGPGDHLGISVYDQPQLSETDLPVRPDGRVSTPLVPDIQAAGRTPSELSAELAKRLGQYVKNPQVSVLVRSFVGAFDQQVRVVGQAVTPLAIPYRARMTLLDVMIETHGLTRFAAGNRAVIVRQAAAGEPAQRIPVRLADLLRSGDVAQNVAMRPGDTLIIPQTWF